MTFIYRSQSQAPKSNTIDGSVKIENVPEKTYIALGMSQKQFMEDEDLEGETILN